MGLNLALTKVTSDREIGTKIYLQLCDFKDAIRIGDKERQELFRCAMEISRKLETVKYHRDNLIHILDDEIQKRHASMEESNVTVVDLTTGAEKEAEAFLMQGKSCLDVLVKILKPLFGIKLHSYGEAGDKVAKSLNGNLKADELARAQPLLELIQQDKAWIKQWFSAQRDTIAHYKTLPSSGFVGVPDQSGRLRYLPPVTNNSIPFHELVTVLYQNLLTFCEDFLALAVSVKFPPGIIGGVIPEDNRDKDYPRKFGMFLASQGVDANPT